MKKSKKSSETESKIGEKTVENAKRKIKCLIKGQPETYSTEEKFKQKFRNYRCEYCQYVSSQEWILDRHVETVHYKICVCQKLCCHKCRSNDRPKDPYRYKPFRGWC